MNIEREAVKEYVWVYNVYMCLSGCCFRNLVGEDEAQFFVAPVFGLRGS